jgi:hypothetical protein
MTIKSYEIQQIDDLGLRLFDLAAQVRALSLRAQEAKTTQIPLHDKKALEWITKLEEWVIRSENDADLAIRRAQGTRRAAEMQKRAKSK